MKSGAQNIGSTRSVRGGMSTILLTTLLLLFSYYRCRDKDQVFRNSGLQVNWGVHWHVAVRSSRKGQAGPGCRVWCGFQTVEGINHCGTVWPLCVYLCDTLISGPTIGGRLSSLTVLKLAKQKLFLTLLYLSVPTQSWSSDLDFQQLGVLGLNPHSLTVQLCGSMCMIYPKSSSVKGEW